MSVNEVHPVMSEKTPIPDVETGIAKAPRTADPARSMRPYEHKAMRVFVVALAFYFVGSFNLGNNLLRTESDAYTYIAPVSMTIAVLLYVGAFCMLLYKGKQHKCHACWKAGAVRTPFCAWCGVRDPNGDYEEWFEKEKLKAPKKGLVQRVKERMGRGRVQL